METKHVIDRVVKEFELEEVVTTLVDKLSWGELQTFLLHIYEQKVRKLSVAEVAKNYENSRFSGIANIDPVALSELDRLFYRSLPPEFNSVELSPVGPVGTNTVLASLDPKVSLVTFRSLEVISDLGVILALECARRRKHDRKSKIGGGEVHLAASHRSLRLQALSEESGRTAHFRTFALMSAGRDTQGYNSLELRSLNAHITAWLEFLSQSHSLGYRAENITIALSDVRLTQKLLSASSANLPQQVESLKDLSVIDQNLETHINELKFTEEKLVSPLRSKYPSVSFCFDLWRRSGVGYYSGICYKLTAVAPNGQSFSLAGGGACDWTRKLLQSKREHLVSSGFGSEMFLKTFRAV